MMSKEDGIMWDNDPHAVEKTKESRLRVMDLEYRTWQRLGVSPGSLKAKKVSEGQPVTYDAWFLSKSGE